jgi:hypothetical protein
MTTEALFGPCQACGQPGKLYRQNTQYVNEEQNWVCLCSEHEEENDEYWAERWAEYYAGCL